MTHRRGLDLGVAPSGGVAVNLHQVGNASGPTGRCQQELAFPEDAALELLETQLLHQPLHTGPELVVPVAVVVEHPQAGLDGRQQVLAGGEFLQGQRGMGVGPQSAGHEHPESSLDPAVHLPGGGDDAHVVEHGLAAIGGAAREVDLEFAGQALGVGMAQEVQRGGPGPGGDVQHLMGAGAGQMAALHVADGVAAGLPGGEPHRGQDAHHVGNVVDLHIVELNVLAGGDVTPASGVGAGDVGQGLEVLGMGDARGDLDPHHLVGAALALSVDAVVQTEHPHHVFRYLTGLVADQHPLELVDVGLLGGIDHRGVVDLDRDHRTLF